MVNKCTENVIHHASAQGVYRARVCQPALLASLSIRQVVAVSLCPPSAKKFGTQCKMATNVIVLYAGFPSMQQAIDTVEANL